MVFVLTPLTLTNIMPSNILKCMLPTRPLGPVLMLEENKGIILFYG
jgi:hypothetical protein